MISTRGRYALRMLTELAERQESGYVTLRRIAERQEISEKYLESIAKELVSAGILEALRGKGGGYRLGRRPEEITVLAVLCVTEGTLCPVACLEEGGKPCARAGECRTLPLWKGLDAVVHDYLARCTLRDLLPDGGRHVI